MTPTLIFDGDCGFCTTSARWIEQRVSGVEVTPWQSVDLEVYGVTEQQVSTAAYWVDESGASHRGEHAVALALKNSSQPWRTVGLLIATPPLSWLAGPAYRLVAKYRYRLPGSTDACRLPQG